MITLGDVLFSTNKAQLKSGGMRNVQKLADFLTQYPQYKVSVEGYTDSQGSDEYNQELSERRADAVKMALIDMTISSDRISASGYGKGFPVASNNNASGRQLNRRVEIILSDENGNIAPR
jgi:outer membrane protein OmpA-like peptidoglycan-associated protein